MLEISCGTIPFTIKNNEIYYLLIKDAKGVCGFPKGHIEENETEEMTALRETEEETSIILKLLDGFKTDTTYLMPNGIYKKVIYFLGEFSNQTPKQKEGFEQFDFLLLPFNKAYEALSYDNTKSLFVKANNFLIKTLNK